MCGFGGTCFHVPECGVRRHVHGGCRGCVRIVFCVRGGCVHGRGDGAYVSGGICAYVGGDTGGGFDP